MKIDVRIKYWDSREEDWIEKASSCSVIVDNGVPGFLTNHTSVLDHQNNSTSNVKHPDGSSHGFLVGRSNPNRATEAANHHSLLRSAADTPAEDCFDLQRTVVLQLRLPWDCLQSPHLLQVP